MSLEVSQKLAVYDTDGARAVLAAYASRDQVDGALMTSFGSILMNLEGYRQHLPNYVLYPEGDEDDPSTPKTPSEGATVHFIPAQDPDPSSRTGDRVSVSTSSSSTSSGDEVVPFQHEELQPAVLQSAEPVVPFQLGVTPPGSPRGSPLSPRGSFFLGPFRPAEPGLSSPSV